MGGLGVAKKSQKKGQHWKHRLSSKFDPRCRLYDENRALFNSPCGCFLSPLFHDVLFLIMEWKVSL